MGHLNLPPSKRGPRQWRLLDLVTAFLFAIVLLFFLLIFTPLGDSLAASGRQSLLLSSRDHSRLVLAVESGKLHPAHIQSCPAHFVHHLPCLDSRRNTRERRCPPPEESPLCLIPPSDAYKIPVPWPESLDKVWRSNMPHDQIADRKGNLGWMKEEGPYVTFPDDDGTMFPHGARHYIDKLKQYIPITGGSLRTALDMGCGAASFGGSLLAEGILTMSLPPRDSHDSRIQFALERGIPAFFAMLGTQRLPFPAFAFDFVHCSQCSIPFTAHNATYFIEVDRLLRPGGYLVISGPPVQWPKQDKEWADLQAVARALCYDLIAVDGNTVIWKKPAGDSCFPNQNEFGLELCDESDDPSSAWYFKLKKCLASANSVKGECAVGSIKKWPERLKEAPARAALLKNGIDLFGADTRRWARRIAYYKASLNLKLGTPAVRNVMDMNALFGGFAAALSSDPVWVMNVVPARKPLTLDVIYDRGLIGVYHD
ncbi:probable methyltransferase PMT13 isoform X2 [Punica granatum]|nr:probable methyltransferase PMT13 isoform X2 [Punica granatum]